ncbi:unnamed protein product, partial [Tenebrio molitor]
LPPEVDELTDEDDLDDDDLDVPVVSDVAGQTEIYLRSDDDSDDDIPLSVGAAKGISFKAEKNNETEQETPQWKKINPQFETWESTDTPEKKFTNMLSILSGASMLDIFENFFSEQVFQKIVDETLRYAAEQKNKPTFSVEIENIKIFIGFLIFSGYNRLPSERDYFSDAEDLGVQLVKDAMSRNRYLEVKSLLHLQDNSKANEN